MPALSMNTFQGMAAIPCGSLVAPVVPLAEVLSFQSVEVTDYVAITIIPTPGQYDGPIDPFCNVSLSLTHPDANDTVWIEVWLPLENWNGRYSATGGGGFANSEGPEYPSAQIVHGYATSASEGGLTLNRTIIAEYAEWVLKDDGSRNYPLILNLAWRSNHDTAVVAKDVINQFYGRPAEYSYYIGCSQGGRQGIAAASKYPDDFDGVVAMAPAVFHERFLASQAYGLILMNEFGAPPFCVFEAYEKAILAECDPLDGTTDGLISDYDLMADCPFDFNTLVGTEIECSSTNCTVVIEQVHADLARNITRGPVYPDGTLIYPGNPFGGVFDIVAGTTSFPNGTTIPSPSVLWEIYLQYFVLQDPEYDFSQMSVETFTNAIDRSIVELGAIFGLQQYDLTNFNKSGGKMLTWTGLADEYIPPQGTLHFLESVEQKLGGVSGSADDFYRVFFAPGVAHCTGGYGPAPVDALGTLRGWVENGTAPETLFASGVNAENATVSRDLCKHPRKLTFVGGDVNLAESFTCQ